MIRQLNNVFEKVKKKLDFYAISIVCFIASIRPAVANTIWSVSDSASDSVTNDVITPALRKWSWPVFLVAFCVWLWGTEKVRPIAKRVWIGAICAFAFGLARGLWEGSIDGIAAFFGVQ